MMSEGIKQVQAVYGSSNIADILHVQESTVRKYCLLLEKSGYEFLKNEQGHRAFFDHDLIVLKKMMSLKSGADMTLVEAVKSVVAWENRSDIAVGDTEEMRYIKHYNDLAEEFKTFQEQQMNFNKELIQEIRNQQEYIEQRLEQRDRLLIQSLRETLEVRKEIATAKKKWWQFWK